MKLRAPLLLLGLLFACQKEDTEAKPPATVAQPSADASVAAPSASARMPATPAPLPALTAHRRAFHAYGKSGDLILSSGAARFVFATGTDVAGHRPLRGALLDATLTDADVSDPLLYFRQAWEDRLHKAHVLFATTVETTACPDNRPAGVLVRGDVEGVTLTTTYCPNGDGALSVHTTAERLPDGASIADELNPGTADPEFAGVNVGWEGEYETPDVTIKESGISFSVTGTTMKAERHLVHVANESFPAALFLRQNGADVTRTLTVMKEPARTPDPTLTAELSLSYSEAGKPLPVQVLLRRTDGGKEPAALVVHDSESDPPVYTEGRVLYLPRGRAHVKVAPGAYELIATHGPTHSLNIATKAFVAGANPEVSGTLARVINPVGWTSADFHLHAAPSPDSRVSLDERVSELACMGVDFAVSTDHNRITDYAPALARNTDGRPAFVPGVEVTTRALGHFNAFPMALPTDLAPEMAVPPYWDVAAKDVFSSSRAMGAKIVEVNHARMEPGIGYFDLARFVSKDGTGGPAFSADFDSLEVHNGFWLEHPDRVREGAADLVGLARRGKHVAAVGNSDSHKMFFEAAGWPRTWVRTPGTGPLADRVIAGLLRQETTISAGPFVELTVDGKPIGATVKGTPGKPLKVHVRVLAPAWIQVSRVEIHADDDVVNTIPAFTQAKDGVRIEADVEVKLDHDAVLYAWADSDTPLDRVMGRKGVKPIGMTGLVWVDADGDGSVNVLPRQVR